MFKLLKNKKNCFYLCAIMAVAFLARFLFLSGEITIISDSVIYAKAGESLVETGKYETFGNPEILFPPGFPLAVGILNNFFHDSVFSLRAVSFIFGMMAVYLFYLVAKELHSKRAGLFAAFFAATNPSLIAYSQEVFCDSMYFFFVLSIFYFYLKINIKYKNVNAAILGALIGFSYLIRPEGILFLILPVIYLFSNISKKQFQAISVFFLTIFFCVAVISPYAYFLYKNTGQVAITTKAYPNLVYGIILNGQERSRVEDKELIEYEKYEGNYNESKNVLEFPVKYRKLNVISSFFEDKFSEKYMRGVKSEMLALWSDHGAETVIILAISFLVYAAKKRILNRYFILLLLAIIPILMFPLFHIESRYLLQVLIFVILLAAFLCSKVRDDELYLSGRKLNSGKSVFSLGALAMLVVSFQLILFLFNNVSLGIADKSCEAPFCANNLIVRERLFPAYVKAQNPSGFEYKIAGEFIENDAKSKDVMIMSRRPIEISFYADVHNLGIMLPYTSVPNIIKFAKANKVNYIVIDERFLAVRDNFDELWSLDRFSSDIEMIFEDSSISGIKVFKMN